MLVGRAGVATALLLYGLLFNFFRPLNVNAHDNPFRLKLVDIDPFLCFDEQVNPVQFVNNADVLGQTSRAEGNFGYS